MDPLREQYLKLREQREAKMVELYLQRVAVDDIAAEFGLTVATVRNIMYKRRAQRPLKPKEIKPPKEPLPLPGNEINSSQILAAARTARNRELIARYEAGEPSTVLGKAFGVSRERVCQILRRSNTIELVHGRRNAARDAQAEEVARIKAEAKAAYRAKIEQAVELVRGGMSYRQARMHAFGDWSPHMHDDSAVAAACKKAGVLTRHGRHRNLSERRARLEQLRDKGFGITEAVRFLRAEGDTIHLLWISSNCPDIWGKASCPVCKRLFINLTQHMKMSHPGYDTTNQQNHSHAANPEQG